jgi:hypothetical protein
LEFVVSLAAGVDFVTASLSCLYLVGLARETATPARRVGTLALALVCGALALEAIVFLSQAPPVDGASLTRTAAIVSVRGVLLAAAAFVGLLLWRGARR